MYKFSTTEVGLFTDAFVLKSVSDLYSYSENESGVTTFVDKVKDYFKSKIDDKDKVGSLINVIAPGAITVLLSALGFGWIAKLTGLLLNVFHVDFNEIISKVSSEITSLVRSGNPINSSQINSSVQAAISAQDKPITEEEAAAVSKSLESLSTKILNANLIKVASLNKDAGALSSLISLLKPRKTKSLEFFGTLLSWLFKIAVSSAGLMVAGDIVNKFVGRSNSIDGTIENGKEVNNDQSVQKLVPTQTKFKLNPSYSVENNNNGSSWIIKMRNDKSSISEMLIDWVNEVYDGLDNLDSIIKSCPGFNTILNAISLQNQNSEGGPIVYIPSALHSKKDAVNLFIDEVAKKS